MPLPYFRKPENRTAAEPQGRPIRDTSASVLTLPGSFPLYLLHVFLFSLFLFSLALTLFLQFSRSQPSIATKFIFRYPERNGLLCFGFSFKSFKEERVGLLGQNSSNIHRRMLHGQKMRMKSNWRWGRGEKESLVSLTRQRPHASLFLCDHRLFK